MIRALALLLTLSACSTPAALNPSTYLGAAMILHATKRAKCDPPRVSINGVCTTEREWYGR